MARVTLEKSVKFKALVRRLKLPKPFVRGLLETMWDVAHECGNPVLGTEDDVEIAAEWPHDYPKAAKLGCAPGEWFKAMKEGRWVDAMEDGRWKIHDYFDHAPDYASSRAEKETERKKDRACAHCNGA